jgi:hypothetical protein
VRQNQNQALEKIRIALEGTPRNGEHGLDHAIAVN